MSTESGKVEARVLLLAPTARDAANSERLLRGAGLACAVCRELKAVCRELEAGAGALVIPEEALAREGATLLSETLRRQPPWSDLPVLVLTRGGAHFTPDPRAAPSLINGVLLERPVRIGAFLSALRSALRARQRQYQIRELLSEQRQTADALREADRRKDEFLAMLAHELRNPLTPIRNGLEILRVAEADRAVVAQTREMMDRQVQHVARLVDDLLDVSRITRGRVELRREPVDLVEIIARTVEAARPLFDARKLRLTVSQPGEPVRVTGDPTRLTQVIDNLLNNAVKYTPEGGQVGLALEQQGGQAVVRVRDTGAGIPADMLPKVFDLFTQVDHTLDRSQGGLGIGLTLVRSLVELHGGSVEAFSQGLGQGSEFVVRLPVLSGEAVPCSQQAGAGSGPGRPRCRILVVDDNVDAANSLAALFRLSGHEVRTAHTGLKVLGVARELKPEVALLDLGLPEMDGFEVARRLRQEPWGKDVLLIALTGYGQEEDRRRSREAGFDHHLTKPADPAVLEKLLSKVRPSCPPGTGQAGRS
jgi:signal transduction histidine kinase/CheY-like chemotaxis protein